MTTESNNTKFKVLVGLLSAMLIALAVYTVSLYNDSKNTVTGLEQQKTEIAKFFEPSSFQTLTAQVLLFLMISQIPLRW